MTRNRLVLLAAALVLVLGASLLIGTRLIRPAAQIPAGHSGIDQAAVAELLARPLQFTHPQPNLQKCPSDGPMTNGLFGGGPVYGQGGPVGATTSWGAYTANEFVITSPNQHGPVVLRVMDLRNGQLGIFTNPYGVGPVYGTDVVNGISTKQYTAIALDTDHSPKATYDFNGSKYVVWPITQGWPHSSGFCTAFQIDGPDFSETFYATAGAA